jgi:two-component system, NtrC family, response regulator HydG
MRFDMQPKLARILVVDDELEMAMVIADELGDRGYRTVALSSAREALGRLRRERFDAVITDLRMADVDGLELLRLSRELDPSRPVILMTGHFAIDTALEADRRGAYHYIAKPFSLSTLVHLLEAALGKPSPAAVATTDDVDSEGGRDESGGS